MEYVITNEMLRVFNTYCIPVRHNKDINIDLVYTETVLMCRNEAHTYLMARIDEDTFLALFSCGRIVELSKEKAVEELGYCSIYTLTTFRKCEPLVNLLNQAIEFIRTYKLFI